MCNCIMLYLNTLYDISWSVSTRARPSQVSGKRKDATGKDREAEPGRAGSETGMTCATGGVATGIPGPYIRSPNTSSVRCPVRFPTMVRNRQSIGSPIRGTNRSDTRVTEMQSNMTYKRVCNRCAIGEHSQRPTMRTRLSLLFNSMSRLRT
jgi:hypothetical protein